ncbi:hypothetical protein T484DRAFT_2025711, partial [Baffinella frigidus]
MLFPVARGGRCRGMRASTRFAYALIAIAVLGLATQAQGQETAFGDADENQTAVDENQTAVDEDPCVANLYTENCTGNCTMAGTCNNQGRCMGDGSCHCFPGFSGAHCETRDGGGDPCVKDRYSESCTETCTMGGTCSRHGRCMGDGSCECFPGFSGESCEPEGGGGDPCVKN